MQLALRACDATQPMDSALAARLLRLAGEVGAPELLRAVLTRTQALGVAMGRSGAMASAIQPPALICGIQNVFEGPDVAEALRDVLQVLGWSALEGWVGWDGCGIQGDVRHRSTSYWRVWVVPAAQGLPSGDSTRLGPAAATAAEEQPARCDAVQTYCSFDDLADARLDPGDPRTGGAGDGADLARRFLPLLRRGGGGRGFFDGVNSSTVEGRLLAVAATLGDVGLAVELLHVMAGDSYKESTAGVREGVCAVGSTPTAVGPLELDYNIGDALNMTVQRLGWDRVGSEVLALLEANKQKVLGARE